MSTALCVSKGGGASVDASAVALSFSEQIAALEKRDLERMEKRARAVSPEELRIAKMGGGEAVALSCQRDNISRTYAPKNRTYYNRAAVALEVNLARWVLSLGKKYSPPSVVAAIDSVGYTPELLDVIERRAREHVAEFTITIPHYSGEDLGAARRRFTRAFNDFNRRFLKERAAEYFGDFVRVFEAHKDGVLHAHIVIECKKSLRRGSLPFKWRNYKGADFVRGDSVAPWVADIWRQFRGGELESLGIGKIHTLQPIRKGVKCFSKYVAKYITKGLGARPLYMRGLRSVAYSRGFLDGCRVLPYDYDKSERITYFSKTAGAWRQRYKRFCGFDVECASRRVRRVRLYGMLRVLGCNLARLRARVPNWGWITRRIFPLLSVRADVWRGFSKWERFAAVRNLCGDAWKAVIRIVGDSTLYQLEDFKKLSNERKQESDFDVVGFVDSGKFQSLKTVAENRGNEVLAVLKGLKKYLFRTRAFVPESERIEFFEERKTEFRKMESGKISASAFGEYLSKWKVRFDEFRADVRRFVPDAPIPAPFPLKPAWLPLRPIEQLKFSL